MDRKQELRRLLARSSADSLMKCTEYIDGHGTALFQRICELDLEGIVAKQKHAPYVTDPRGQHMVQDSESPLFTMRRTGEIVRT